MSEAEVVRSLQQLKDADPDVVGFDLEWCVCAPSLYISCN